MATLKQVLNKITYIGLSDAEKDIIKDVIKTSYNGSATARKMLSDWVDAGKTIEFEKVPNKFSALVNQGKVRLDFDYLKKLLYITTQGKAIEFTPTGAILHELVHALMGKTDNNKGANCPRHEWKGETVIETNKIRDELGLSDHKRASYIAVAEKSKHILQEGFEYTAGHEIDSAAIATKKNMISILPAGG